ncbi:hypothetical protein GF362_05560 [Candidatus Dojkabacteria bacterium]|nr:hypothetical protein [Candidatus Dojkabacteria bacterium]
MENLSIPTGQIYFPDIYRQVTSAYDGAFIPARAAQLIAEKSKGRIPESQALDIFQHPQVFPYSDSLPFVQQLITQPDINFAIWTQGELDPAFTLGPMSGYQVDKFNATNWQTLLDRQRRDLTGSSWTDELAVMGFNPVIGGVAKTQTLEPLTQILPEYGFEQIAIVEDRPSNLEMAAEVLKDEIPFQLFLIDRKGIHADLPPFIQPVQSLDDIRTAPGTFFGVDLDYTLIDHQKTRDAFTETFNRL